MMQVVQNGIAHSTPTLSQKLELLAGDIKLAHSVFALPFACFSAVWAGIDQPHHLPGKLILIVLCMVAARTVAMTANRIVDARLDAANPRTAGRVLPSGRLSAGFYIAVLVVSAGIFIAVAGLFYVFYANPWPVILSAPLLAFMGAYPLMKRFTRFCHFYLGMALALAPVCAWVAVRGQIALPPLLMGLAVLLWTAGFDILYATQDFHSDRRTGVFSLPAALGIGRALGIARLTHAGAVAALVALGLLTQPLGWVYFAAVGATAAILVLEHLLVRPNDLSRLNVAFFTLNGIISLMLGAAGIVDVLL